MKVSINQHKPKEDQQKPREVAEEPSECARLVQFIVLIAIQSVLLFTAIIFWNNHGADEKFTGVERKINRVEAEFKILIDEIRETEQMISDIVDDVAVIAEKFNRSAEQHRVTPQRQPEPVNMPFRYLFKNMEEFPFTQKKDPLLAIFQSWRQEHHQNKASTDPGQETEQWKNKIMEMDKFLGFPRRIRRAANSGDTKRADDFWFHYAGDESTSCKIPKQGLKTAEVRCKIWPQSISCNSFCVYGSAYPEGIVRTLNCSFQRNRWSNYFEECQPFVNCKVQLIGPGSLKCFENQVSVSPSCHIGCEEYEDHDATQPRKYECKANGTWNPPLPPCAATKSGIDLIRAPHVLEHKHIDYPKSLAII